MFSPALASDRDDRSELVDLRRQLLRWWESHQRRFPWRETRNPYLIFVAEVLLHRTRANQVVDLYYRMQNAYPTVDALAKADEVAVSDLLYSAGLQWRVKLLLSAARDIRERFNGRIPREQQVLESIPGIGHYIASAIRCFAFGEPAAVVDTNTVRVLSRVYGLEITDTLRRSATFHDLARTVLDAEHPREFNFALLDLAALICKPRVPECAECPIQAHCLWGQARMQKT